MSEEWINRGKNVIMNTYSQFPIVLEKGDGCYVWDANGKKYLDFVAGIAVNCLGYNNPKYIDNITQQLKKMQHCSNLYWMEPSIELGELLVNNSCCDKVFFCNSGAEANEAAFKLCKKYAYKKYGEERNEIISMTKSFHGRTMLTITATGQTKYQKGFNPLYPGIKYAEFNNFKDLTSKVTDKTCAIIVEPIQGEGGITPANKEFLQQVRDLCDEKDIVLIYDEVQCGIGRTGKLFAYELSGVKPDIVSLAKGLGGGIPIGAILAVEKVAEAFEPGNHASTFGGNHIACISGKTVISTLLSNGFLENVTETGKHLTKKLNELKSKHNKIVDIRGNGLIQGIELNITVKDIILKCIENGLLLVGAGDNVIRFVPPLIITKEEIDEGIAIIDGILSDF